MSLSLAILSPTARIAIGLGLVFTGGVLAAEGYERVAPWGVFQRLERLQDSLPARDAAQRVAGARAQADVDRPAFTQWSERLQACEALRASEEAEASVALGAANITASTEAARAFRLGRATCGATDAPVTPAGPSPAPGGVFPDADLRDTYRPGAFTPGGSGAVPASGSGARPR